MNEGHLKDVRKAAFEASKKAVRRLSLQHSQKKKSSTESRKSQRDRSKELFQKMTQSIAEEDEYVYLTKTAQIPLSLASARQ